ncbi:hypothetical protein LX99_04760 [Mucilaginibacter oryzae]|uniref:Nuclear transport factor 2 family protein n=1 Tax=Mucilaginibacter oryzae TaxID=468058 RepID=A0A316GXV5_9SPHI|nr:hypothetical protein [Mucilaginibacter oryzae]PWK69261.1 hypothetical protein LX99_04760 [Mucilaginibacter oryzae]
MKNITLLLFILAALPGRALAQTAVIESGSHGIDPRVSAAVFQVLDEYMTTFNAKDLKGWEDTYQFPHYRLAGGKMSVLERAGLRDSVKVFGELQKQGWDHSQWDHRNIVQASADKVHVDTRFSRFRADGSLIGHYESLYILTKENGRWGVKFRSSYAE